MCLYSKEIGEKGFCDWEKLMPVLCSNYLLLLLLLELLHVEVELITLKDVSVGSSGLTGSGADGGQETSSGELVNEGFLEDSVGVSVGKLSLNVTGLLNRLSWGGTSLLTEVNSVVLQVPLSEWSGIDLNNGVLGEHLSSHILTVGSIVDGIQDSGLVSDVLTWPDEVTSVES